MTILSVAYPFATAGCDSVGGAEQILSLLDEGITAAGHRSLVIACEGSRVRGELIAIAVPGGPVDGGARRQTHARWRAAICHVLANDAVDLVHLHGVDFLEYLPVEGPAVLATLHLPPTFYPVEVFHLDRPRTWLNCVSNAQLRSCPPSPALAGAIENGICLHHFAPRRTAPDSYILALGRICPEKGFHLAIDAAERAGVPLYLGGDLFPYPEHERYWREELEPRLRPPHRFLGPVSMRQKAGLLARARCLVVTSLVPETSSLVAMEALACATPVVAFPAGALAEIVDHGRTGFLVDDAREMAEAIHRAARIDPRMCRQAAHERFAADRMVRQYLELFEHLLQGAGALQPAGGSTRAAYLCEGTS